MKRDKDVKGLIANLGQWAATEISSAREFEGVDTGAFSIRSSRRSDDMADDDAISFLSDSTNATMDDNPGPGRVLDKFIYQAIGRKIERFAGRVSIPFLPPGAIVFRIMELQGNTPLPPFKRHPLSEVMDDISILPNGNSIMKGLRALLKQTR